jgi:hypothetical protein
VGPGKAERMVCRVSRIESNVGQQECGRGLGGEGRAWVGGGLGRVGAWEEEGCVTTGCLNEACACPL